MHSNYPLSGPLRIAIPCYNPDALLCILSPAHGFFSEHHFHGPGVQEQLAWDSISVFPPQAFEAHPTSAFLP